MSYIYVIISSLLFGVIPTVQSFAINNGATASDVVFYSNMASLIFAAIVVIVKKINLKIDKKDFLILIIMSLLGLLLTDYCLDVAYTLMPVGLVTVIHFTYPTLVCAADSLIFKEKFGISKLISIILSITGLALISLGGNENFNINGVLITLVSALAYAFVLICTDKSRVNTMEENKRLLFIYIISICFSSAVRLYKGIQISFEFNQIGYLALAGVMLALGNLFLSKGIKKIGSASASLISTLEPICSLLISLIIYNYNLTTPNIIGCILIIASLIPSILFAKQ